MLAGAERPGAIGGTVVLLESRVAVVANPERLLVYRKDDGALVAVLSLVLVGCGGVGGGDEAPTAGDSGGNISGTLSTFGFSLPDEIATTRVDTCKKAYPQVQVKITSVRVMMIDNQAVSEAGLSPSDVDTADWSKLSGLAEQLTVSDGGKPKRIGFDPKIPEFLPMWVRANGGALLSDDGRTAQLNDPKVVEALTTTAGIVQANGGWDIMSLWTLGSTTIIHLAALNNVPRELYEAARVDGASYLQLFRRIAIPLTKPALIVTFVFEFRASWTDLMRPLIYLRDNSLFTLPRGLKVVLDQFGQGGEGQWEVVLAASVIATLPMLIIFFLGQRYFVEGIATTGRKG